MATDTVVISAPDVVAAPQTYTVPDAAEIVPLAVSAVFDGSGAGGAYLPTLVLIAPSGQVMARAIADATVAAGASAEVSWFPHVAAAAASTSTGYLMHDFGMSAPSGLTLAPGTNGTVSWSTQGTDGSTFSIVDTQTVQGADPATTGYHFYTACQVAASVVGGGTPKPGSLRAIIRNPLRDLYPVMGGGVDDLNSWAIVGSYATVAPVGGETADYHVQLYNDDATDTYTVRAGFWWGWRLTYSGMPT